MYNTIFNIQTIYFQQDFRANIDIEYGEKFDDFVQLKIRNLSTREALSLRKMITSYLRTFWETDGEMKQLDRLQGKFLYLTEIKSKNDPATKINTI